MVPVCLLWYVQALNRTYTSWGGRRNDGAAGAAGAASVSSEAATDSG